MTAASALQEALHYAGGSHTLEDIEAGVAAGRYQLWNAGRSVLLTEIQEAPRKRWLNCFLAAGCKSELVELWAVASQWGREQGCTHACLVGRKGWSRSWARDYGFVEVATMMEAPLVG